MINMRILFLALFASLSCCAQNNDLTANRQADSFINVQIKKLHIPGMAIAVVKQGKVIKQTAYGFANLDWKNRVTANTCFQIASCTKLLTSSLLLKTMFRGKISLEDPLIKHLDSLPEEWKDIKIKNLISHSSGIADYYASDVYLPTEKIMEVVKKTPLLFKPGTKEQYGQSDFMVLSYILEKIYNKPFTQILHDEVAVPLNMKDGAFDMEFKVDGRYMRTDIIRQKVTTYYDLNGKMQAYKFLYPQYTYPAGGYFASISDMANWAAGMDKQNFVPTVFSDTYIYDRDLVAGQEAGFSKAGWVTGKEGNILYAGHSGGPGLGDVLRFPLEGYTFIVLTNDGELLPGLARAIAGFYIKGLPPRFEIDKMERK